MTKKPDDSEDLWALVTRSVRAYKPTSTPASKKPLQKTEPPVLRTRTPANGMDRSTETKLKRGKLRPEAKIDLHGMSEAAAFAAFSRFIRRAVRDELRTVLVVTGKGKGILKAALKRWSADSEFSGHILALTPATREDGGEGAFYLRLRK